MHYELRVLPLHSLARDLARLVLRCDGVHVSQELHHRYYEPLARIASSVEEIVNGPPMKKLLFMTDPAAIDSEFRPLWEARHPFHLLHHRRMMPAVQMLGKGRPGQCCFADTSSSRRFQAQPAH